MGGNTAESKVVRGTIQTFDPAPIQTVNIQPRQVPGFTPGT